jgi:hypothetical protein
VGEALLEGGALVILVVFLFLGEVFQLPFAWDMRGCYVDALRAGKTDAETVTATPINMAAMLQIHDVFSVRKPGPPTLNSSLGTPTLSRYPASPPMKATSTASAKKM